MLPDFGRVKKRANRDLSRWVRQQVPAVTPLVRGVATLNQHEGRVSVMTRLDASESTIDYQKLEVSFELTRAEMRQSDIGVLRRKLADVAVRIGEAQTKRMLEIASEAAASVGNVVHAGGELTPEMLLEVLRRVQMDFDERTLQPQPGFSWVMHPDTAAKVLPKAKEWEKDPKFRAEYERIIAKKREEWRDREADRKLVG